MWSFALVISLASLGCGATITERDDDPARPDAGRGAGGGDIDAPQSPSIDAMPSFLPACMAKGYTAATGLTSLYRVGPSSKWLDAQAACNADVPGATHLVVLSNQNEVELIKTKLGWIGLSDTKVEGTFVTVTKEPNDLRPFNSGQPDNGSGSEDCVQMKSNGGLDDDQCGNSHVFTCECDGQPDVP